MNPDSFFDQLSSKIDELFPEQLPKNLKNNLRAIIETSFSKLDLVTREEFDAQKEVLLRTREKVDLLQKQLAALEENQDNSV
jgi:BMFP domain-containing protein YqiC